MEAAPALVPHAELAQIIARDDHLRDAVFRWAMGHTRHPQNAQDLYQDTLTRALDPRYQRWDRDEYPSAGAFLGSVMNGLARNRLRSSYAARRADFDEQNPPQVAAPQADPDGQLQMVAIERKRAEMEAVLRARVAGKRVPLAVLDEVGKGTRSNVELARVIQCTVAEVVAAKQLLRDHARIVKAERPSSREVA